MTTKVLKERRREPVSAGLIFSGLCSIRNNETLLRLHRAHLSVALNLTGITASMLRLATFPASRVEVSCYAAGGVLAIILNYLWFKVIERNSAWLDFWNEKLIELEQICGLDGGIRVYTSVRFTAQRAMRTRFHNGWWLFTVMVMLYWGSVASSAVVLLHTGSSP